MNLWLRLLWISIFSRFRSKLNALDKCVTPFRCWPTDLDVLRHMNNGIYFSIMDLARVDLMIRAGLASKFAERGWYPVVGAETMSFKKSIKLFSPFTVESQVIGWDEKAILLKQTFLRGSEVQAEAVIRARFLKKTGGSLKTSDIMELAGITGSSPAIAPWIENWNRQFQN